MAWLKRELANSKATWKVLACDMPLGRELEIADLLRFIRNAGFNNTIWLTQAAATLSPMISETALAILTAVQAVQSRLYLTPPFANAKKHV